MSKYVLKRTDQGGGYVKNSGDKSSYTQYLQHARQKAKADVVITVHGAAGKVNAMRSRG